MVLSRRCCHTASLLLLEVSLACYKKRALISLFAMFTECACARVEAVCAARKLRTANNRARYWPQGSIGEHCPTCLVCHECTVYTALSLHSALHLTATCLPPMQQQSNALPSAVCMLLMKPAKGDTLQLRLSHP